VIWIGRRQGRSLKVAHKRHAIIAKHHTANKPLANPWPVGGIRSELIAPQPEFWNQAQPSRHISVTCRPLASGACPCRPIAWSARPCACAPRHAPASTCFFPRHSPLPASIAPRYSPICASNSPVPASVRAVAAPLLTPYRAIVGPALPLVHAGRLSPGRLSWRLTSRRLSSGRLSFSLPCC